jgi:RNA polymerase sigma-70 factor (ECF subfamily)
VSRDRSDVELLGATASQDAQALAALYDRYAAGLNGLALRITGDAADAEEVLGDVFAQVWRDAGRFDPSRGSVASWLVTITRSRALDTVRARGRRARLAESAAREAPVNPAAMGGPPELADAMTYAGEREAHVRSALDALPEEQRQVLELAYFEGLSQSEIAARLATPLGTVKTRARLAFVKLRDLLRPLAPEESR